MTSFFQSLPLQKYNVYYQSEAVEIFLIVATLFFSAAYFCFPVAHLEEVALLYPWWAKKITFGNIQFYEVFFLIWIAFFGYRLLRKDFWLANPLKLSVGVFVALVLWCGVISLTAPTPWLDAGRTLRLLLNVAMVCAVFYWSQKNNTLLLAAMVSGFLAGTIVNLVISYQYPLVVCGVLRMAGQNTPGVSMAVAVHMCAWLFSSARSNSLRFFSLIIAPIFIFGSFFSASKAAWFIAIFGMLVWIYIFLMAKPKNPFAQKMLTAAKLAALFSVIIPTGYFLMFPGKILHIKERGMKITQSTDGDICAKITDFATPSSGVQNQPTPALKNSTAPNVSNQTTSDPQSARSAPSNLENVIRQSAGSVMVKIYGSAQSNSVRMGYLKGTLEIVSKHPLGVGYSGFYRAYVNTELYKSGNVAPEVSESEANPHSSFLWYLSAGGILGGLLAIVLFILLLKNMLTGLVSTLGVAGYLYFATAALSFLTIGLTVPYIYNSIIFIIPAAIAAAWIKQGHREEA